MYFNLMHSGLTTTSYNWNIAFQRFFNFDYIFIHRLSIINYILSCFYLYFTSKASNKHQKKVYYISGSVLYTKSYKTSYICQTIKLMTKTKVKTIIILITQNFLVFLTFSYVFIPHVEILRYFLILQESLWN